MKKSIPKTLWLAIGAYALYFSGICFLKLRSFSYNDFDLAIHDQVIWNILHGAIYNSILGIDFLGNHMHPISFIIAPFYALLPHPLTLLFLQSLALGLGALPLYLLARDVLGNKWAMAVAIAYLLYPALGYINLFEFHPTALSPVFMLFMVYFFYRERFYLFLLFALLAMLCQENIPLAVMMSGFVALIKRRNAKWVIWPIALGAIYFWLCVGKLMPYFNKKTINFLAIYSHLGDSYASIAMNIIKDPVGLAKIIFVKQKIVYLLQVFGPLAFLPILSPLALLMSLPFFMQHLISLRYAETTIYYHYLAEMIPFIFVSYVFGIKKLISLKSIKKQDTALIPLALLIVLASNIYLGPHFQFSKYTPMLKKSPLVIQKEEFVRKVPKDAAVVATFEFLPHLSHRSRLYSFHHVYMGFHTLSTQAYQLPDDVGYALLDFDDVLTFRDFYRPDRYKNLQGFLGNGAWAVSDVRDDIVFLRKGAQDEYVLYQRLTDAPKPQNRAGTIISEAVEFTGYDVNKQDGILHLSFYWRSLAKTEQDINVFFDFADKDGSVLTRMVRPVCYRIFPSNAWSPGDFIREERYISLSGLPSSYSSLKMGFFDYASGQLCATDALDKMGRIELNVN